MITQSSIENLKARLDIVDVVSSYVRLKKAGVNYSGLCPFHAEKTPSFVVSPAKQIYHCFSCGVSGDSIKFVMEHEKLNYPEAIEKLASANNFHLEYEENTKRAKSNKELEQMLSFYQKKLDTHQEALAYLVSRGISNRSIEDWEIGYAPSSHEQIAYAESIFLPQPALIELGVFGKSERVYARFGERIMFPIYNHNNKLVGFGGRTMGDNVAKYINSPQTELFNKSKLLYGYNKAKESIYKSREIIVTEGYLDVIMLHQAGFTNATATLGTALTKEHLPLLQKGEPKVILSYDGDNAGKEAAFKASMLLSQSSMQGGVVIFEGGLDPADMVVQGKAVELQAMFEKPKPFVEYIIEHIASKKNLQNPYEKQQALEEVIAFLQTLDAIIAIEYKSYIASILNIDQRLLKIKPSKAGHYEPPSMAGFDYAESALIKSMMDNPDYIDEALNYVTEEMFNTHRLEYELVMRETFDHPLLVAIEINDKINTYEKETFVNQVKILADKHYKQQRTRILNNRNLGDEKAALIKEINEKIKKVGL